MLTVYTVATEMIASAKPLIDAVTRRDKPLADQLRRACQSVLLNIAEGTHNQGGSEVCRFFTALGSAREARAAVAIAVAWDYVDAAESKTCDELLDRTVLYRLSRRQS
jgi:four helix bundle protein